jgi:hypothetical protein
MLQQARIAALVVVAVSGAAAQQAPAPPPKAPPAQAAVPSTESDLSTDALPAGQLAIMLDSYAMFQAQQQLSIPDEKFGAFAARLKKLQDVRRRNHRIRQQILQELRRLAGPRAPGRGDDDAIRSQLKVLRDHDERAASELRQAYDTLDEVLDARQQARYRMFEEVIEQRKLDLIVKARERARANRGEPRR